MPIRLNLLAEAQAAEEVRRRDPVKRALWIGALLTALMLVWISSLQLRAIIANQQYGRVEAQMNARTNDYKKVVETQKKITDINHRLISLYNLSTNRFLNADLLNALQHSVVDEIQLSQVKVDQTYTLVEGTKARTNGASVTPPKPPTSTEKIVVTLEGSDSSPSPGEQVARYKGALAKNPYFESLLGSSNQISLKSLSAPQISPESGRAIVLFSLECRLPEQKR